MQSPSAYLPRSSSVREFVASLDEEIALPYLSLSVSHHGLDSLGDPRNVPRALQRSVQQPDSDYTPARGVKHNSLRVPSTTSATPADTSSAEATPPRERASSTESADGYRCGLGGLTITVGHGDSSGVPSLDAGSLTSPVAVSVDYAGKTSRGFTVTVSRGRLRVRKRTLIALMVFVKASLVGAFSLSAAGTGGFARWPAVCTPVSPPAAVMMTAHRPRAGQAGGLSSSSPFGSIFGGRARPVPGAAAGGGSASSARGAAGGGPGGVFGLAWGDPGRASPSAGRTSPGGTAVRAQSTAAGAGLVGGHALGSWFPAPTPAPRAQGRASRARGGASGAAAARPGVLAQEHHPMVRAASSAVSALAEAGEKLMEDASYPTVKAGEWLATARFEWPRHWETAASKASEFVEAQRDLLSASISLSDQASSPGGGAHAARKPHPLTWLPSLAEAKHNLPESPSDLGAAAAAHIGKQAAQEARTGEAAALSHEAVAAASASSAFPVGFDRRMAQSLAWLCGLSYHCGHDASALSPDTAPDTARIAAELAEQGMELVETFVDGEVDTFAFLARERLGAAGAGARAGAGVHDPLGLGLELPPLPWLASLAGGAPPEDHDRTRLYLIFRGSVSALNKDLNFDFFTCGYNAAEACFQAPDADPTGAAAPSKVAGAKEGSLDGEKNATPADQSPVRVHRGFLRAWQSLRPQVLQAVRREGEAEARAGRDVELQVSGHSLGGAMAMLASAEIQHVTRSVLPEPPATARHAIERELHARLRGRPHSMGSLVAHKVYTFAAPRLGNEAFAEGFARAFCRGTSYWAVQSGGDAVPHLPLQAMGFHHPPGRIVTLNKYGRTGAHLDNGDDRLHAWVPRGFNPENWVRTHDILSYGDELEQLARSSPDIFLP